LSSVPGAALTAAALASALLAGAARQAGAQIAPDSARAAPDSAEVLPDSLRILLDSARAQSGATQDSVPADTIFYNLPVLESGVPTGFATGVWVWDRQEIMTSAAHTLAELLSEVPGLVTLLGGDYGTPLAVSALGVAGGGLRIVRDGFELYPLDGGLADLQRIALVGVQRVRFERFGGEMLIELTTYQHDDGRPFTLVEAGTGQLDTNLFRGTFADPTALLGSVAAGLERVETRGYGENEGGNRTGGWLRYQLHRGDRAGLALDWRRMGSATQVSDYASSVTRTDVTLRGRIEVVDGVVVEAYTGRSSHDVDDDRPEYDFEGGSRSQHGVRAAIRRDAIWARGAYRLFTDDDLLSHRVEGSGGYTGSGFGASGQVSQASWGGESTFAYGVSGWVGPVAGVTFFGSLESGTYAGRSDPLLDELPEPEPPPAALPAPPPAAFATTERTVVRAGTSVTRLGTALAFAGLRAENDLHLPLATELDRASPVTTGAERYGVEAWGSLPTPWSSLRLEGSYQWWESEGPYLPKQIYHGAFVFHRTYLESGNFELWWSIGVRGHDPMLVFVADDGQGGAGGLERVPFFQSWYGRITARIVAVQLFFTWENFTRRQNLQDFPGRVLPLTRSFFGLR